MATAHAPLTDAQRADLHELLRATHYRLQTLDGLRVGEIGDGEVATGANSFQLDTAVDLANVERVAEILGLDKLTPPQPPPAP